MRSHLSSSAKKRAIALCLTLFKGKRSQFRVGGYNNSDRCSSITCPEGQSPRRDQRDCSIKGLIYGSGQSYRIALPLFALWLCQRLRSKSTMQVNERRLQVMNQCSLSWLSRGFTLIVDVFGTKSAACWLQTHPSRD